MALLAPPYVKVYWDRSIVYGTRSLIACPLAGARSNMYYCYFNCLVAPAMVRKHSKYLPKIGE